MCNSVRYATHVKQKCGANWLAFLWPILPSHE